MMKKMHRIKSTERESIIDSEFRSPLIKLAITIIIFYFHMISQLSSFLKLNYYCLTIQIPFVEGMHAVGALWQKDDQMDLETLIAAAMMLVLEIRQPMKKEVLLSVSNQIGQCVFPLKFQTDAKAQKIQCLSCTYQPAIQIDNYLNLSTL